MRQNEKRRSRNRANRSAMKSGIKKLQSTIESGDAEAIQKTGNQVIGLIARTSKKGGIHHRKAARLQSRAQQRINKALAPAAESSTAPSEESSS
jgi:small subunit ribosomal protein S20